MAPQMQASLARTAGRPPMSTVVLPLGKALTVGWWPTGGNEHTCRSPATAAGMPPISTVATPGPVITPPCVLVSPTRAAAGMAWTPFLVDLHDAAGDLRRRAAG